MRTVALILVIISVVMASGAYILSSFQGQMTENGYAYNITGYGISALYTLAGFLGIIATIMVFAIIIGVIMDSFG